MPTVYQILHGTFSRKNLNGTDVILKTGDTFVPSPSELAADKFRLKPVGTVEWDSDEAKNALLNTNRIVYPDFGPKVGIATAAVPVTAVTAVATHDEFPQEVGDITTIKDVPTALKIVAAVETEELLDTYLQQESDNRPRVRKAIITAIEARRTVLQGIITKGVAAIDD